MRTIAGTCATCRFAEQTDTTAWVGEEERALERRYPLTCARAEMRGGRPQDAQTLAFTMDGSSYRASLLVAPEFGCVMFEEKR